MAFKKKKTHPYRIAEDEAKAARRGQWGADTDPIRPADWRKSHKPGN